MKKVLVIDDERSQVQLLKSLLEANLYEVIAAADGQEGLDLAKKNKPDLIVMDVMMPKMDGAQAVQLLKEDPSTKDIPIIFLTAILGKEEEREEGLDINVGGLQYPTIAKPVNSVEFLTRVKNILEG